jgi:hypothetical protein
MAKFPPNTDDAARAGRIAYLNDHSVYSNPYVKGGEMFRAWRSGWYEAAADQILRRNRR